MINKFRFDAKFQNGWTGSGVGDSDRSYFDFQFYLENICVFSYFTSVLTFNIILLGTTWVLNTHFTAFQILHGL